MRPIYKKCWLLKVEEKAFPAEGTVGAKGWKAGITVCLRNRKKPRFAVGEENDMR